MSINSDQCRLRGISDQVLVCDGTSDGWSGCYDNSDEAYCENWVCPTGKWKCDSHICIDKAQVCDGDTWSGCEDESDEAHCQEWDCLDGTWKCLDNTSCIPILNVCDAGMHCSDGSDESEAVCMAWVCPVGYWKCLLVWLVFTLFLTLL